MEEKLKATDCLGSIFILCLFFMACTGIITFFVSGGISNKAARIESLKSVLNENNSEFRALHAYPVHSNKGHFLRHDVVVEGVKTGKRISVPARNHLPVPGEIWRVTVRDEGYEFAMKVK